MPRNVTVTFEDGTQHVYQGAPDDVTPDAIQARASKEFGKSVTALDGGRQAPTKPSGFGAMANLGAGLVRGAGSIGATLLAPVDALARSAGVQNSFIGRTDRRQAMDEALSGMGADTSSLAYQGGKLGSEIAGTAGVGGTLARGAAMIPGAATKAAPLLDAIGTAGFKAGGMAGLPGVGVRAAGGSVTGGAAAGLVDPDSAGTGAVVGAALPGGIGAAGWAGKWLASTRPGQAVASAFRSGGEKAALQVLDSLGMRGREAELIGYLKAAPELVPGARPTVAQALQGTPASERAGVIERVVSKTPGGGRLLDTYAAQQQARMGALEGFAPTNPLGLSQSKEDMGNAIMRYAQAERGMAADSADAMYAVVDPGRVSRTIMPIKAMEGEATTFAGPGSIGKNADPWAAVAEAKKINAPKAAKPEAQPDRWWRQAKSPAEEIVPTGAKWDEVMRLRGSLNERWNNARNMGDDQAAAALAGQKKALDAQIESSLPPDMLGRWKEANASWAALETRFHTGPQATLFQTRNGVPLRQGGEVPGIFWNGSQGLADDAKAFRKLVQDNPALMGEFKSMITTEGLSTQTKTGQELSAKFPQWVDQHITGLREILSPQELASVQRIAADIKRALKAGVAGKGPGGTSDTFQLGANALNGGFLDSTAAKVMAAKVPYAQGVRSWAAETVGQRKAKSLADLLADPEQAVNALQQLQKAKPKAMSNNEFQRLLLRSAPIMAADR